MESTSSSSTPVTIVSDNIEIPFLYEGKFYQESREEFVKLTNSKRDVGLEEGDATGVRVYAAAIPFSIFLKKYPTMLANKSVVEIGCGELVQVAPNAHTHLHTHAYTHIHTQYTISH